MGLLLTWLALGMFGVYEFRLPGWLMRLEGPKSAGAMSAVAMGILAGMLSTPCSFGILGAAVTWAQLQPPALTLAAFCAIGLGMALPYVVLASWPGLVDRVPRAGAWTERFRQGMGFILLAVALFLFMALPADRVGWVLAYALVFAMLVWLWGGFQGLRSAAGRVVVKVALVGAMVGVGWWFVPGEREGIQWQDLSAGRVEEARSQGRPVVVDFTAAWCLNCRTVDALVYQRRTIKRLFERKGVAAFKADLTRPDPEKQELLLRWTGQTGIPFTVLWLPGKDEPVLLAGVFTAGELAKHLRGLPDVGGVEEGERQPDKKDRTRRD